MKQYDEHETDPGIAAVLAAANDGPPFVGPLESSAVLAFSGSDARTFLHGQLANDVTGLPASGSGRSLLLNHKGHAMAEAAVLRTPDAMLCVVDDDKLSWVRDTLERHIVFDDVRASQPSASVLTIQGARSREVLRAGGLNVPDGGHFAETVGVSKGVTVLVYPSHRSQSGGFDLLVMAEGTGDGNGSLAASVVSTLSRAGAVEVGSAAMATARVSAGVATAGSEGGEGVLPQESGLVSLISNRKGCYLGQEIMARIEARGKLRRELATIELDSAPAADVAAEPRSPAARAISANGKTVGLLGTVARMPDGSVVALCVLRRDVDADVRLSVGAASARRLTMSAPIMPA